MKKKDEIKIVPSDFDDAIKKFDIEIENLANAYKNIAKKNQELVTAWTGDSGDVFFKSAYSIERTFAQKIAIIREAKENLKIVKELMIKQDAESASKISN